MRAQPKSERILLFRGETVTGALPVQLVSEIMRPQRAVGLTGTPSFVAGVATVRGRPLPVVDFDVLVAGRAGSRVNRWIVTRTIEGRAFVLTAAAVAGVYDASILRATDAPPLLRDAARQTVSELALVDTQLVALLELGFVVPAQVWDSIESGAAAS